MDKLDFELLDIRNNHYFSLDLFQTTEERVISWLKNQRCRSIFSRQEILNLFKINHKIQLVKVNRIKLKKYDKIIVWTQDNKYYVLEVVNIFQ